MSEKSEVPTTEVILGCSIFWNDGYVWVVVDPDTVDTSMNIRRVGDDGFFTVIDRGYMTYGRHTFTTGDTIYALLVERFQGDFAANPRTWVWICTERATMEETENDIFRKMSSLYEGISLKRYKDLYNLLGPDIGEVGRRIYDSNGDCVGTVKLIKLVE